MLLDLKGRRFSPYRILLPDYAALVDGEGAFAGGEGDAAEVAAGVFAGGCCSAEGFFRIVEVVGGEHPAARKDAMWMSFAKGIYNTCSLPLSKLFVEKVI